MTLTCRGVRVLLVSTWTRHPAYTRRDHRPTLVVGPHTTVQCVEQYCRWLTFSPGAL